MFNQVRMFLSAVELKDIELLKAINPTFYDWLYDYYHPFTPSVESYKDIPFYLEVFHKEYLGIYSMIYRKVNFLKFEYPSKDLDIFQSTSVYKTPCFHYPLSGEWVIAKPTSTGIVTNIEVDKKMTRGLKHPSLKDFFIIGCGDKWLSYCTESEWRDKKCNDSFQLRLQLLRAVLGEKKCITGYYVDKIVGRGLIGDIDTKLFEIKEVR